MIGAYFRLMQLGAQDLWYDEAFTAWAARLPLADLLRAVAGDVHPPLWYLVEAVAVRFLGNGNPPSAGLLRLPAALCSIAALALIPALSKALGLSRQTGTVATWVLALSPFQVWYAQEGRMYALLLLAVEAGALGLFSGRLWLYGIASTVMLYTHNIGGFYWLLLMFWPVLDLVIRQAKGYNPNWMVNRKGWLFWSWVAALLYLPWGVVAAKQAGAVAGSFWVQRPTVGAIPLTLHKLLWGPAPPWLGDLLVPLSALLVLVAVWGGVRGKRWALLWLAFVPLLITWIVSQFTPILIERLMIGCTPFLALLLGEMAGRSENARLVLGLAGVLAILVVSLFLFDPTVQRGDVGRFVEPVQAQYDGGDAVLHTCIPSYVLLSIYAPEMDHYLWRQANDLSQSLTDQTKQAMHMRETTVEQLLQDHARVWVYYSDSPVTSEAERAENARIRATYGVVWSLVLDDDELIESGVYLVEARHEP